MNYRSHFMESVKEKNQTSPVALLGIESSGLTCAVGISREGELLVEISANIKNIHSRRLAPFVEYVLQTANIPAGELSAIVLSAGPGSFTGLRIGYSVAKGMAHALKIPIVEVPTLDVWAYQAGVQPQPVLPVIDAHRGEIFCALYRWEEGKLRRERDYTLLSPPELPEFLPGEVIITGADAENLQPQLEKFLPEGSRILNPSPKAPQIWALLQLGLQKFRQNLISDVDSCEPLYMRAFKGGS
jgi:tRNA threonylcarbamoyladenosine biosynthesis protein TsaB